jgi:hypothetical protein
MRAATVVALTVPVKRPVMMATTTHRFVGVCADEGTSEVASRWQRHCRVTGKECFLVLAGDASFSVVEYVFIAKTGMGGSN